MCDDANFIPVDDASFHLDCPAPLGNAIVAGLREHNGRFPVAKREIFDNYPVALHISLYYFDSVSDLRERHGEGRLRE